MSCKELKWYYVMSCIYILNKNIEDGQSFIYDLIIVANNFPVQ